MQTDIPKIRMPEVTKFVQLLAWLFDVGTQQDQKITVARSYTGMQDRYSLLTGRPGKFGPLVKAIHGQALYPDRENSQDVQEMISVYLGNIQHLVSWLQAVLFVEGDNQQSLDRTLIKLFAVPQLALFIVQLRRHFSDSSPFNEFDRLLQALTDHECDPVAACKTILRDTLKSAIGETVAPKSLTFYQTLKSLDNRSTKTNASIKAELATLDEEIKTILPAVLREALINKLCGIYHGMMAIKRLKVCLEKSGTFGFNSFIKDLKEALGAYSVTSKNEVIYKGKDKSIYTANASLLTKIYAISSNVFFMDMSPYDNDEFEFLLRRSCTFCNFGVKLSADFNFRMIRKDDLDSCYEEIEECKDRLYYEGVKVFLTGLRHLRNDNLLSAEAAFIKVLDISDGLPLGIARRQAALLCVGLKIKKSPNLPPRALNPLLIKFIHSSYQECTLSLAIDDTDFSINSEDFNMSIIIREFNSICRSLMDNPSLALIDSSFTFVGSD